MCFLGGGGHRGLPRHLSELSLCLHEYIVNACERMFCDCKL
jgi:hypothetical protein